MVRAFAFTHNTPKLCSQSIGNMPKRKQQAEEDSPSVDEEQQYKSDSSSSTSDSDAPLPDSEESSDDEAGEAFQQVDVDFGFYCPQEKDFLGMRTLMQNYLDGQEWACSDMVEAIIAQVRSFKLLTARSRWMQHISAACKMHASLGGGRRWQRRLWPTNHPAAPAGRQCRSWKRNQVWGRGGSHRRLHGAQPGPTRRRHPAASAA